MKGLNDITNSYVIRNCLRKHIGRELRGRSSQKIIDRNVKVVCQPDQLFNIRIVNARFPYLKILVMYECLHLLA